jgi:hypothetical protein
MSTAETDTKRDSIDAESIDAFFAFADDETVKRSQPEASFAKVVSLPNRDPIEPRSD